MAPAVLHAAPSPMSRTPFDQFAKRLVIDRVGSLGSATPDAQIDGESQHADLAWTPDPVRMAAHAPRDLLDRMVRSEALLEFFHQTPDLEEFLACVRKLLTWHGALCNAERAARAKSPAPVERRPAPLPPPLWVVSSGTPLAALRAWAMAPLPGWPAGVYVGAPGDRVRVVAVSELPRTLDTLLVRLMGAGVTLRDALRDLAALPPDSPERSCAMPFVLRLRIALPDLPSPEHEELAMDYEQMYQDLIQRTKQEGFDQGFAPLLRLFTRKLGRPLTDDEQQTLTARLTSLGPERLGDVVLDLPTAELAAWLGSPDAR